MNVPVQRAMAAADNDDLGLPEPAEPLRPLGGRQYAFWILQQLEPGSSVANLGIAFRTTRALRWWPLHAAVNHLIGRHPALRTRFPAAAGVPLRHVSAASDVQLTVDVSPATDDDLAARVHEALKLPFDLARDLPLRVTLFPLSDGGSAVLLTVHHAVSDAASLALLVTELCGVYDGIAGGGIPEELLPEVPAAAEPRPRPSDSSFWAEHLRGVDTAQAVLPWARPDPARPTFAGATMVSPLAPETVEAMAALRRANCGTDNIILLAAYYLALFRHGAGPDLVVGVPVTSRGSGAVTSAANGGSGGLTSVGFEISTLPLRIILDPDAGFAALARQVRDVFLAGAQHAVVSVEQVLAELGHHSPDWRVPLFRYLFSYRPWDDSDLRIGGERGESVDILREDSRLDLQLAVLSYHQPPLLMANYSTEVHDEAGIAALVDRMQALLRAAAADPACPVRDLDMATDDERAVMGAANSTRRQVRPDRTVLAQFMAAAQADPAAAALAADDSARSYGDLAGTARRIAARLRAGGVRPADIVALALPRGVPMAAAVLGVWAAGACYLPVDPDMPESRLAFQLADAGARLLVTESGAPPGPEIDTPVAGWADLAAEVAAGVPADPPADGVPARDEEPGVALDAAAYVIYTSGSTGQSRGVIVTHRNLANVVADFAERLGLRAGDAVLWSTTTAFDISGLELFLPLSIGGLAVVAGSQAQTRPREVLEPAVKHDVSVLQGTPTFWRLAVTAMAGGELRGRTVLCGGEPMTATLAADLLATGCRLLNVYGPTETTIWSTAAEISGEVTGPVPIGRPIANTSVFVADQYGAELAPGLLGELCIAGTGVSAGYLGRPELTAERFVTSQKRGRYYRTGDLARWRADGALELFGRNDRQVKLRGQRIELPEIEAVLQAQAEVAQAAVVLVGDPQGDGELRAFIRPVTPACPPQLELLWQHLRAHLPSGALPSRLMVLREFPVSPNGKLDYTALRSMEVSAAAPGAGQAPPGAPDADPELTKRLLSLLRAALGRPTLSDRDHFFLNGGHSLLAAQLATRIAETEGLDVPLRMIFDHPTARQLSGQLTGERG